MNYYDNAIEIIKSKGYKSTKPRRMVIKVLYDAEEPLSPYEISDEIKKIGEKGDVVSTYRTLEILEKTGLIHRVLSTGKYLKCHLDIEHSHEERCHHNFICEKCGKLSEVKCIGFDLIEKVISSEHSFKINKHALEFYGVCENCLDS